MKEFRLSPRGLTCKPDLIIFIVWPFVLKWESETGPRIHTAI